MDNSKVEELLIQMWSKVFKKDDISVKDDFFDLGGHSLMAAQLTTDIRDSFNIELSLLAFFDHPTILELSEVINRLQKAKELSSRSIQ